jgi:hypothetical protein
VRVVGTVGERHEIDAWAEAVLDPLRLGAPRDRVAVAPDEPLRNGGRLDRADESFRALLPFVDEAQEARDGASAVVAAERGPVLAQRVRCRLMGGMVDSGEAGAVHVGVDHRRHGRVRGEVERKLRPARSVQVGVQGPVQPRHGQDVHLEPVLEFAGDQLLRDGRTDIVGDEPRRTDAFMPPERDYGLGERVDREVDAVALRCLPDPW